MARTINVLGRNWSHHQMHGLIKSIVDGGWTIGFWRNVQYNYADNEYAEPILSDEVYCEIYRLDGEDDVTYRKYGATLWKALCNTIDSCPQAQKQAGKLPV